MPQKKSDIYARFLNLARAVEELSYGDLNSDLKMLLEHVAVKSDELYRVTDLIMDKRLGSPATVHARIKKMVDLGYFLLQADVKDSRVKYVCLANRAKLYLEELNRSLKLALNN